jgi:hypothetical protein
MNAPGVNGVRRDEINKAGRLVADPSAFEFVMATEAKRDTNHQVLNFHADYFNTYTVHLLLLCTSTNKCTIKLQIINYNFNYKR